MICKLHGWYIATPESELCEKCVPYVEPPRREGWQSIDSTTDQFYRGGALVAAVWSHYRTGLGLPDWYAVVGDVEHYGPFHSLASAKRAVDGHIGAMR